MIYGEVDIHHVGLEFEAETSHKLLTNHVSGSRIQKTVSGAPYACIGPPFQNHENTCLFVSRTR